MSISGKVIDFREYRIAKLKKELKNIDEETLAERIRKLVHSERAVERLKADIQAKKERKKK